MSNLFISMKMFWVCEITRLGGRIAHGSFGWHDVPACVCCDADKWSYETASAIWMVIIAVPLYFVHPLASAVPGVICVVKIYNVTLKRVFKSMGV